MGVVGAAWACVGGLPGRPGFERTGSGLIPRRRWSLLALQDILVLTQMILNLILDGSRATDWNRRGSL